ncbi:MAG: hypothetical protein ACREQJ_11535, partial [Candidatus Binatia bacterium]
MLVEQLCEGLASEGFNLIGMAAPAAYDARVREDLRLALRAPWARSVVVVGNGGGDLWRRVEAWAATSGGIADKADPVDEYTTTTVERVAAPILADAGVRSRLAYPFRFAEEPISFVDLAAAAGLGAPSLLRVLVHPVYGPWMALRAAILVDVELDAPRPAEGYDPCPACVERSCIAACPGSVVRYPEGWDVEGCIAHRRATG